MSSRWAGFYREHQGTIHGTIIILTVFLGSVGFLDHAFHIDEPMFLRIASHIRTDPWNPYGFNYNWGEVSRPAQHFVASPPLFSYLLRWITGGQAFPSEFWTHLALLPLGIIAALSLYRLIDHEVQSAAVALFGALLFCVSPTFVISNNLAMPDMACVALALLALEFAWQGWKRDKLPLLLFAGLTLGCSALCRFSAVPLLACFPFFGFRMGKKWSSWVPSLIAGLMVASWFLWSRELYGENQVGYFMRSEFLSFRNMPERFLALTTHLCLSTFLPVFSVFSFLRRPRALPIMLTAAFLLICLFVFDTASIAGFKALPDYIFVALGFFCLADLLTLPRSPASTPYRLWVLGALSVPMVYVFFASKYLLLVQPALILLLTISLSSHLESYVRYATPWVAAVFGVALLIAFADFQLANSYRRAGMQIGELATARPEAQLWFRGHWGFQFYLEKQNGKALEADPQGERQLRPGDWLAVASYPAPVWLSDSLKERLKKAMTLAYPLRMPIRTMNPPARAGFYASATGNLPYSFSRRPLEIIQVYSVITDSDSPPP